MSRKHVSVVCVAAAFALFACSGTGGSEPAPENCSTSPADSPDEKGELMRPGGNCISCHQQEGAPAYTIAGTVMGDYADDADCEGLEGVVVEITGADGKVLTLETNSVGNFLYAGSVAKPYTARVLADGEELAMLAPQNDGNCANCHTEVGTSGAPGRIVSPAVGAGEGGEDGAGGAADPGGGEANGTGGDDATAP